MRTTKRLSSCTTFHPQEVIDACAAAAATGDLAYEQVFTLSLAAREAGRGCRFLNLTCKAGGKSGRLALVVSEEVISGQIAPLRDPQDAGRAGDSQQKVRERQDVSFGILRGGPPTAEGADAEAPEPLPHELQPGASPYFAAVACLNHFFTTKITRLVSDGVISISRTSRKKEGTSPPALIVQNSSVIQMYQSSISASARENAGNDIPYERHITRIPIKFNEDGKPRIDFPITDLDKPYKDPSTGKLAYHELHLDGETVNVNNVHKIPTRSTINAIVILDAVCLSQMGISIPIGLGLLMVKLAKDEEFDFEELFGGAAAAAASEEAVPGKEAATVAAASEEAATAEGAAKDKEAAAAAVVYPAVAAHEKEIIEESSSSSESEEDGGR